MPHIVDSLLIGQHPYYPTNLSLPGYAPPEIPFGKVLAIFFSGSAILFLACWFVSGTKRHLSIIDRAIFCWFGLTGVIHLLVEGTVVAFPNFYKSTSPNVLFEIFMLQACKETTHQKKGQPDAGKEYAQADSRYASRDSFTICMEAVTAFVEGPLCFVIMYGMLKQKPWRFTLQLAVSLGQMYGDVLYFATTCYEGLIHSRPEPLYFYFYFWFINSIWIVVPALVICYSAGHINQRVAHAGAAKKLQ